MTSDGAARPDSTAACVHFDPHVHTGVSPDAVGSVEAVLDAAVAAGLDALAITDHDAVRGARDALAVATDRPVTVVPGVEVSTADGHLLALGVRECPPTGAPLGRTVAWIRRRDGLAVVPHPFQRSRHGIRKRDLVECDGIEVFNAWAATGIQNRRARRFADRRGYPHLGGSDAHDPAMVGRGYTLVSMPEPVADGPPSDETLLSAVAAGRTAAGGRSASTRRLLGSYSRSLGTRLLDRVP